ncbi:MAG: L-histidine N(alpha)-methyltransferase [Oligoflexales bacterium]
MQQTIDFYNLEPAKSNFFADVVQGLRDNPKHIPSKYFYDERGSKLFDKICCLKEYYPTRTESSILDTYAEKIDALFRHDTLLIELGSGNISKIQRILKVSRKVRAYAPVDISYEHLLKSCKQLNVLFPDVKISAICADYQKLAFPPELQKGYPNKAVFFPGSTLGNMSSEETRSLFQLVREILNGDGLFIVGLDLVKNRTTLQKAYNDSKGVTSRFNLNLLERVNNEIGANFDLKGFEHRADYNETSQRIEMHLVSKINQEVAIKGEMFHFEQGESICTEFSRKYEIKSFCNFTKENGFDVEAVFTDPKKYFAEFVLKPSPSS